MKNIGIIGVLVVIAMIVVAIVTAGKMGKTNKAFARGKIVLDESLQDDAIGIKTLFIIVRDTNQPMPPFGAFRKTIRGEIKGDVYEFALTYDNIQRMREGAPWPEKFTIKARLDRDGRAGMDQPGDLVGELTALDRGSENLTLKINKKI